MSSVKNALIAAVLPVAGAFAAVSAPATLAGEKPNVIFFLVDDMGWLDSSVYGSTFYKSPAMERLAKSSVRFTQAYSASPLCSPSRASMMSGQYPARHGITAAVGHMPVKAEDPDYQREKQMTTSSRLLPESRKFLAPEQYTLAEAFRDAGYRTGFVGKWHLGVDPAYWPEKQGFEFSFHGAPDPGPPSYFSPYRFRAGTVKNGLDGEYITDRATEEALNYIHKDDGRPFFLCLWHWGVHSPFQAKEKLIEYYRNHPDPQGKQLSPTMAAMLQSMDESLGRLLDDLERTGLDKNTIIVFTSDNGGVVNKEIHEDGNAPATNNGPLRKGKASLFEGGTRVPALVRWPGVTDQGGVSDAVIVGVDYYPTLLEMCGIERNPAQIVDGISFVPVLKGNVQKPREIYCFFPHDFSEYSPAGAWVRQGDWKLIEVFYISDIWQKRYLLYNLKDDVGETTDLSGQYPERVAQMAAQLKNHYMTLCAHPPIPNPDFDPSTVPVGGWLTQGAGILKLAGSGLVVEAPGIRTRGLPRETGAFKLVWKMRTQRTGNCRIYWSDFVNRPYVADRQKEVAIISDASWHEYSVTFETAAVLYGLRLDFGMGAGSTEVEMISLSRSDGVELARWDFEGTPGGSQGKK